MTATARHPQIAPHRHEAQLTASQVEQLHTLCRSIGQAKAAKRLRTSITMLDKLLSGAHARGDVIASIAAELGRQAQ